MKDNIANLIEAIKGRDTIVNDSKGPAEIRRLEVFLSKNLDSNFHEFYSYCDGFGNDNSFMSIWKIEDVISNKISNETNRKFTIIGDFLMESDYIIVDLNDNASPLKLQYEDTVLSNNVLEFLEKIVSGKFDLY